MYKVLIRWGKGKNFTQFGSTPLKRKEDVVRWVGKHPINKRTKISVLNTNTKKIVEGDSYHIAYVFRKKIKRS